MKKTTLFITVFHSFISKNILNTDVFRIIREQPDLYVVMLVPKNKEEFFKSVYQTSRIIIHGIDTVDLIQDKNIKRFSAFSHLLMKSHYLWYKKIERLDKNRTIRGYVKYWFEILFTKIFGNQPRARKLYRNLFLKRISVPGIREAFDQYSPDMVFATDVFDETDVLVMREAKVRKTHLLGMVRSWDNCYSKGILRVIPDKLIVNNYELRKEAIELHDMPENRIEVTGLPQYDQFVKWKRSNREDFCRETGLDPDKRIVLFSPAGTILSDTDKDLCDIFKEAIVAGQFSKPVQIHVRNHPHHPADVSVYDHDRDIVVEYPGKRFSGNLKETELTQQDSQHLGDSLYHADVVVYVATTLGLDSLIFDKPQIIIDFDGYQHKPYAKSVKRYHHEDHMKKMIACGGVNVAENADDLVRAVNAYLEDPTLDRDGRKKMVDQQLVYTDGKSGIRVGTIVVDEINKLMIH